MNNLIPNLAQTGEGKLDQRFGRMLGDMTENPSSSSIILNTGVLMSRMTRLGHISVNIRECAGTPLPYPDGNTHLFFPEFNQWKKALYLSGMVGFPGERKPLILDERGRLYLYRYWAYEDELAKNIIHRIKRAPLTLDASLFLNDLHLLLTFLLPLIT